jgi:hypothetical protein
MNYKTFNDFRIHYQRSPRDYQNQRFGQAFLNDFDYIPEVAAIRSGPLIWEDDNPSSVEAKLLLAGVITQDE